MNGTTQIVTFAPGDAKKPFLLIPLVNRYLAGCARITVNPLPIEYALFLKRFKWFGVEEEELRRLVRQAENDGVSHLHLCMLHYEKMGSGMEVVTSKKKYADRDRPLNSKRLLGGVEPVKAD